MPNKKCGIPKNCTQKASRPCIDYIDKTRAICQKVRKLRNSAKSDEIPISKLRSGKLHDHLACSHVHKTAQQAHDFPQLSAICATKRKVREGLNNVQTRAFFREGLINLAKAPNLANVQISSNFRLHEKLCAFDVLKGYICIYTLHIYIYITYIYIFLCISDVGKYPV